ncbi:hypothetical protein LZ012_16955 [Dechloromonas sp. XY25]|uniref:Uncharacterized protein n=1 Tax=Dechloromonas hankyongensis TaxID=2908002 RepID=A0ABS9K6J2_9RHOO|nr:hypothetical protein [Dechloromonas hankyongensis]MCG2578690.1 hypothetical protein [Dechloromonas hankyongensis]
MMRNQILTAIASIALIVPLLQACERSDRSPSASVPGSERQARTPSAQDRMLESAPPAAGLPSTPTSPSAPGSSSSPSGSSSSDTSGSPSSSTGSGSTSGSPSGSSGSSSNQ